MREALNAVTYRAKLCEIGVIREVRKPNPDGTSSYMRPMPGAARMYPETDTLPIKVDLKKIKLPELLTDKAKRYVREFNLNDDMANAIVKDQFKLFERLANECKQIKPAFLAEVLIGAEKNIKSQFNIEIKPKDRDFEILFKNLNENKIPKDAIYEILKKAHSKPIEEVVKNFKPIDNSELESQIKETIEKNKGAPFNALMGLAMKELRGKADGKTISELLKKLS